MFNTPQTGQRVPVLRITVGVRQEADQRMVACDWPIPLLAQNKAISQLTSAVVAAAIRKVTDTPELAAEAAGSSFADERCAR